MMKPFLAAVAAFSMAGASQACPLLHGLRAETLTWQAAPAQQLTLEEITKITRELEALAVKNPDYVYPVKVEILEDPEVNAHATVEHDEKDKAKKPQAVMAVYTGYLKFINNDKRILRAVIAHELSHLSFGHPTNGLFEARDLNQYYNRQMEREADMTGCELLIRAGYSKQDMIDMLLKLGEIGDQAAWLRKLTSTHASPKQRASEIADEASLLRSLVLFDVGLAFWDARNFGKASEAFSRVAAQEPRLWTAKVNAAATAVMHYYDFLPEAVRKRWYRPDFGPILLANPVVSIKDPEIREEDLKRYDDAVAKIEAARGDEAKGDKVFQNAENMVLILDPRGDKDRIRKGALGFATMLGELKPEEKNEKLRYGNNAALALERLGDSANAKATLLAAISDTGLTNVVIGENFSRAATKNDGALVAVVMAHWLNTASEASPYYEELKGKYASICKDLNIKQEEVEGNLTAFEPITTLVVDGKEIGLYDDVSATFEVGGKPDRASYFDDKYKRLLEMVWLGGDLQAFVEDDAILRITSRKAGSYVDLLPVDRSDTKRYRISVGMSESELSDILDLDDAQKKNLSRLGVPEEWHYFIPLMMGIQMKDGKVAALTFTAVDLRY